MSRQVQELESVLQQQIVEHGKLLKIFDAQHAAMRAFDLKAMDVAAGLQEACRLRIGGLESRRRALAAALAKAHAAPQAGLPAGPGFAGIAGAPGLTLAEIAGLYPQRGPSLLKLRDELKAVLGKLAARTHVVGKVAGAVLGHLNTVVRLLAGAVERAGLYTKTGVPRVSARIGTMDAVG